ncbi:MAG: peptidoglycan-binding domain-containing protein [Ignavibacteriales bacterium]
MALFKLKEPFGASYRADPTDILNTKTTLGLLGYYQVPKGQKIGAWTDDATFDGIRAFQKDHKLSVDGFMRPGGETERTLNARLAGQSWKEQNANAFRAGIAPNRAAGPYVVSVAVADQAVAITAAVVALNAVAVAGNDPEYPEDPEWGSPDDGGDDSDWG